MIYKIVSLTWHHILLHIFLRWISIQIEVLDTDGQVIMSKCVVYTNPLLGKSIQISYILLVYHINLCINKNKLRYNSNSDFTKLIVIALQCEPCCLCKLTITNPLKLLGSYYFLLFADSWCFLVLISYWTTRWLLAWRL